MTNRLNEWAREHEYNAYWEYEHDREGFKDRAGRSNWMTNRLNEWARKHGYKAYWEYEQDCER